MYTCACSTMLDHPSSTLPTLSAYVRRFSGGGGNRLSAASAWVGRYQFRAANDSHFGTNLRSTLAGSNCHIAPVRASTPNPAPPRSAPRKKSPKAWSDCRVVPLAAPAIGAAKFPHAQPLGLESNITVSE